MNFQNDDATVHYNIQDYLNIAKDHIQISKAVEEPSGHKMVEEVDLTTSDDDFQDFLPSVSILNSCKNTVKQSPVRIIECRTLMQPTANAKSADTNVKGDACIAKAKKVSFNLPQNETQKYVSQNSKTHKFDAKRNHGFIGTKVEQSAETKKDDTKKIIVNQAKGRSRPKKTQDTTATKTPNTQFKNPIENKGRKQTAITQKTTNKNNITAPIENSSTISNRQQITAGDNITSFRQLTKVFDNNSSLNVSLIINNKTVLSPKPKRAYTKRTPKAKDTTPKKPQTSRKKNTGNKIPKTKDTKKTTAKKPQNAKVKEAPKQTKRVTERKKKVTEVNVNVKKNTLNSEKECKNTVSPATLDKIRELNYLKIRNLKLKDKGSILNKSPEVQKSTVVKAINSPEDNGHSSAVMPPNRQNEIKSAMPISHALQLQSFPQAPNTPMLTSRMSFTQAPPASSLDQRPLFPQVPSAPLLVPRVLLPQDPDALSSNLRASLQQATAAQLFDQRASIPQAPTVISLAQRSPFLQVPAELASTPQVSTLFLQSGPRMSFPQDHAQIHSQATSIRKTTPQTSAAPSLTPQALMLPTLTSPKPPNTFLIAPERKKRGRPRKPQVLKQVALASQASISSALISSASITHRSQLQKAEEPKPKKQKRPRKSQTPATQGSAALPPVPQAPAALALSAQASAFLALSAPLSNPVVPRMTTQLISTPQQPNALRSTLPASLSPNTQAAVQQATTSNVSAQQGTASQLSVQLPSALQTPKARNTVPLAHKPHASNSNEKFNKMLLKTASKTDVNTKIRQTQTNCFKNTIAPISILPQHMAANGSKNIEQNKLVTYQNLYMPYQVPMQVANETKKATSKSSKIFTQNFNSPASQSTNTNFQQSANVSSIHSQILNEPHGQNILTNMSRSAADKTLLTDVMSRCVEYKRKAEELEKCLISIGCGLLNQTAQNPYSCAYASPVIEGPPPSLPKPPAYQPVKKSAPKADKPKRDIKDKDKVSTKKEKSVPPIMQKLILQETEISLVRNNDGSKRKENDLTSDSVEPQSQILNEDDNVVKIVDNNKNAQNRDKTNSKLISSQIERLKTYGVAVTEIEIEESAPSDTSASSTSAFSLTSSFKRPYDKEQRNHADEGKLSYSGTTFQLDKNMDLKRQINNVQRNDANEVNLTSTPSKKIKLSDHDLTSLQNEVNIKSDIFSPISQNQNSSSNGRDPVIKPKTTGIELNQNRGSERTALKSNLNVDSVRELQRTVPESNHKTDSEKVRERTVTDSNQNFDSNGEPETTDFESNHISVSDREPQRTVPEPNEISGFEREQERTVPEPNEISGSERKQKSTAESNLNSGVNDISLTREPESITPESSSKSDDNASYEDLLNDLAIMSAP